LARKLSPHVLEVDGANHGMMTPGRPLTDSIAVLGRVIVAMEEFLDTIDWPGPSHTRSGGRPGVDRRQDDDSRQVWRDHRQYRAIMRAKPHQPPDR
jgi:hypothetical protein